MMKSPGRPTLVSSRYDSFAIGLLAGKDVGSLMDELDEVGPVDYLVVEFPPATSNFTGEMAAELAALAEAGTIRILDVLILTKDNDGTIEAFEIDDLDAVDELVALKARSPRSSPPRTSPISPRRWRTAPPPVSSSGRTAGQPRSHRRGVPVDN